MSRKRAKGRVWRGEIGGKKGSKKGAEGAVWQLWSQLCPNYAFSPNYAHIMPNYISTDYRVAVKNWVKCFLVLKDFLRVLAQLFIGSKLAFTGKGHDAVKEIGDYDLKLHDILYNDINCNITSHLEHMIHYIHIGHNIMFNIARLF